MSGVCFPTADGGQHARTSIPSRWSHKFASRGTPGRDGPQVWCEVVALACDLLAWTQMLALAGNARRRLRLCVAEHWPWAADVTAAITRLQAIPSS
jgi:hypothetical protein